MRGYSILDPGTVIAERYVLQRCLGKGGLGAVYKAVDTILNENVALKILHSGHDLDDVSKKRFILETKITRSMEHPNIVRIYDFIVDENVLAISMELIEGQDLKFYIRQNIPLSETVLYSLLNQILSGLEYAHGREIVHRDIKPHNFMLRNDGILKILDFGIAKFQMSSSALTVEGSIMGTPEYMSPEQALGKEADHRSDIYSFGAVCYELFTGEVPYKAGNPLELLSMTVNSPIPDPATITPDIHPVIRQIIIRCLQKELEHRYSSVTEIQDLLSQIDVEQESSTQNVKRFRDERDDTVDKEHSTGNDSQERRKSDVPGKISPVILLIDDDSDFLETMKDQVSLVCNKIVTQNEPKKAIDLLKNQDFAIVITDYEMDELNGIEILEIIAKRKPHVKRILLTGAPSLQVAMDAVNRGAVHKFFIKPYDGHMFLESIKELLSDFKQNTPPEQTRVRKKILVVFDSTKIRKQIQVAIEKAYDILFAEDSAQAIRLMEIHSFDAFLTGQDLADMTGMELLNYVLTHVNPNAACFLADKQNNLPKDTGNPDILLIPLERGMTNLKAVLHKKLG